MGKKKGSFGQVSTLNPEQQKILSEMLGQVSQGLESPGFISTLRSDITQQPTYQAGQNALMDILQAGYQPEQIREAFQANVARPAIEQFSQEIAPTIQQAAVGAGGGRSSMVPAQVARAGERLQTNLAGQLGAQLLQAEEMAKARQQAGVGQAMQYAQLPETQKQQQLAMLSGLLGMGISPNYQELTYKPGTKGFGQAIGTALGAAGGSYFGNPMLGAKIGGQIGSAF